MTLKLPGEVASLAEEMAMYEIASVRQTDRLERRRVRFVCWKGWRHIVKCYFTVSPRSLLIAFVHSAGSANTHLIQNNTFSRWLQ